MTSLAGGDSRDDSRGMLENTYENVASIKAATAAAGNSTSLCVKPYPEKAAPVGAGSSFSTAAVLDPDNSPAYQPGLPINYPTSSGFSSAGHHLLEPFYEAYIIKPKPVYACSSNPTKQDTYAGSLHFTSTGTWLVSASLCIDVKCGQVYLKM